MDQIQYAVEKLQDMSGNDFNLQKRHFNALLAATDEDMDGLVVYSELADIWVAVLDHVTRENIVNNIITGV